MELDLPWEVLCAIRSQADDSASKVPQATTENRQGRYSKSTGILESERHLNGPNNLAERRSQGAERSTQSRPATGSRPTHRLRHRTEPGALFERASIRRRSPRSRDRSLVPSPRRCCRSLPRGPPPFHRRIGGIPDQNVVWRPARPVLARVAYARTAPWGHPLIRTNRPAI
jgi:hypothetical protein